MNSDIIIAPQSLPADQNPAAVYLSKLAPSSQRTQRTALDEIARHISGGKCDAFNFPWHMMRYQHTQAIRAHWMGIAEYKASTINRYLSALRGVLKEARRLGLMSGDDYTNATDIENVKHKTLLQGRMLPPEDVKALIQACLVTDKETSTRDAAIIALMYVTGMRRSEVTHLQSGDFDIPAEQVKILHGKGNKDRTAYIAGNAKKHLMNWLRLRGTKPGPMFLTVDNLGNLQSTPMNEQAVYDMLVRRGKQAGIADFSPHDLRRTAISEMLARGIDIATVAKIVGHDSLDTTRRYDLRDENSKKAVTKVYDTPI